MIELIAKLDGVSKLIQIIDDENIIIDSNKKKYSLIELENHNYLIKIDNKIYEAFALSNHNGDFNVVINQKTYDINILTSLEDRALNLIKLSQSDNSKEIKVKSPMPGLVLKINKNIGDKISLGETVMVLEAMKMENEIKSPKEGELVELFVSQGSKVEKNISLFAIK
jgi:biotin carboxyl carrier protein